MLKNNALAHISDTCSVIDKKFT